MQPVVAGCDTTRRPPTCSATIDEAPQVQASRCFAGAAPPAELPAAASKTTAKPVAAQARASRCPVPVTEAQRPSRRFRYGYVGLTPRKQFVGSSHTPPPLGVAVTRTSGRPDDATIIESPWTRPFRSRIRAKLSVTRAGIDGNEHSTVAVTFGNRRGHGPASPRRSARTGRALVQRATSCRLCGLSDATSVVLP